MEGTEGLNLVVSTNKLHVSSNWCYNISMHAVSDPDGDNVRCRWASNNERKDDCDNVCGELPPPIELHRVI